MLKDGITYTVKDITNSIINSYSAIFFSQTKVLGVILLLFSFLNPIAGIFGIISVFFTNVLSISFNLDKFKVISGYYGFNASLTGIAIGSIFAFSPFSLFMLFASSILILLISVLLEGKFSQHHLPYVSIPFLIALWCILLAAQCSDDFTGFGILPNEGIDSNVTGIMIGSINDLCSLLPDIIKEFFLCISYIFFQSNLLFGVIVSIGLFLFSRIGFSLAVLNHVIAYITFTLINGYMCNVPYHYFGFNFIFTAIAIGCYYVVPSKKSILWSLLIIPLQYLFLLSSTRFLSYVFLPTYSFAFCATTILFLYFLNTSKNKALPETAKFIEKTPEKTLYNTTVNNDRLSFTKYFPINLPFIGEWKVSQGYNGAYTHKGNWKQAWDFVIEDNGQQYFGKGTKTDDYYCFGKPVISPANAIVISVENSVEDNEIGYDNKEKNWGNYIILKVSDYLFITLCHLKKGSIIVVPNQSIQKGQHIAQCGNSGHSPYPHLHMQIQSQPFIGSTTIEYPLMDIVYKTTSDNQFKKCSIPNENDTVCNAISNSNIYNTYKLSAYKYLNVSGTEAKEKWELKIDSLGLYYIDDNNGNYAWFYTLDNNFYFYRYEGKKDTYLYYFYLSNYNIKLSSDSWFIKDDIPLSETKLDWKLILQDLIAPITLFYNIRYSAHTDFVTINKDNIQIHTDIESCIFNKKRTIYSFKTIILDKKIISIDISHLNEHLDTITVAGEYYE